MTLTASEFRGLLPRFVTDANRAIVTATLGVPVSCGLSAPGLPTDADGRLAVSAGPVARIQGGWPLDANGAVAVGAAAPPVQSLAVSSLTSGAGNGASINTASVSPAANSLLVLWVTHAVSGGTTATPSGLGLTWTLASRLTLAASTKLECWTAPCGAVPPGAITIALGAVASVCWDVDQVMGAASLVATNTKTATGSGTASAVTYNTPAVSDLLLYGCGAGVFGTQTPNAGWTELADVAQAGPSCSLETQVSPASPGTAGASTLSVTGNWGAIGIELAVAPITVGQVLSGLLTDATGRLVTSAGPVARIQQGLPLDSGGALVIK
jgi:hypothetical protein